jgi:predicted Zn-dependent protease
MLGEALLDYGRPKPALRAFARALKSGDAMWLVSDVPDDTSWRVRVAMARIHLELGDHQQAAECLARASALRSGNADLEVLMARALDALGRPIEAGRHLERATAISHGGPGAFAAFGDFFTKKAEDALLRGLVENPESRALIARIERLRAARAIR